MLSGQVAGENPAGDAIVKLQDPSTKLQGNPELKFQIFSYRSKPMGVDFEGWNLELLRSLDLGVWFFSSL